ncbi:hypothetical protein CFC21_076504 [Triticum aestivum]|uniref:GDSL esterase/lipase n=2 Tax=Triticum aestivum TaxID=4565 RepID=A0A9R1KYJ1_WHEAT|nr:GDSL esterase/lipase At5g55050-like [Triticum aestivum]KAF7071096.1 hypothetical protein CFC21_076504 [Triticum aestivum]
MGSRIGMVVSRGLPCVLLLLACCWLCEAGAGLAPALYVLGDSQADAGTNNHLVTVLRADHPHNGVDYPGCKATGRFSNGKNFVDFLAEHLKLPSSPPPYLSICNAPSSNSIYLTGVNFASGGAGVSNQTNQGQCISFDHQIDHHFSKVNASLVQQLGQAQASAHLSRSIFAVAIGGNDILNYVRPSLVNQVLSPCPPTQSPDEFVASLALSLQDQLQRLYKLGMRRMFIIGAAPLGCCPVLRGKEECDALANYMSSQYNIKVASLLRDMSDKYPDMLYSLFDPSIAMLDYFQRPEANGYSVVDAACCGLGGEKNAMFSCTPASSLCNNRTNHVFWDFVHPTEITAQKLTAVAFHGSAPFVTPRNVGQLCDTAM